MSTAPLRKVKLWDAEVAWETRDDGSVLVWQKQELGRYPTRLSDRIAEWAERFPDRLWMAERTADGADWHRVTYGDMQRRVRSIGQTLLNLGLSVERPLVILSGNSVAHGLMALGAQYVGIPSAAIAPAYALSGGSYDKLVAVRDQITPGAVFVEDDAPFRPAIDAVFANLPVLCVTGQGAVDWDTLNTTPVTDAVDTANAKTGPDTVAKFLFTSGTTGSPKAVIQTQRMMCANMEMVTDCYNYLRDEPPIQLDWAPWNHVAGGNLIFNLNHYNGGSLYIDDGRPVRGLMDKTIRNLREVKPNIYWNVPVGYEMLVEAMRADRTLTEAFFENLKLFYYAGAAMARHTWDDLEELAVEVSGERVFLSNGLGTTETAPFFMFNTDPEAAAGNLGIPAKGLVMKLVPTEGKWEVRAKGPTMTPGYWRNEALTREAYDEDGFYCLGDALRWADPDDPSKGFFFDGRVAENFKLATGTWVGVGALRAKVIDALGGIARDVVIAGEGHNTLAGLIVPFRPEIERVVPGGAEMPDAELFEHPALRETIAQRMKTYNATATGSSLRVPRVVVLSDPLDLNKGEVTDKGSVNQRAVLRERKPLVEALYTGDPRAIDC